MDFAIPSAITQDLGRFRDFIQTHLTPNLSSWTHDQKIPRAFFHLMGKNDWFGFKIDDDRLVRASAQQEAALSEELAKVSPGVAIAALAHVDLGLMGLSLFGSRRLRHTYGADAVTGKTMMCLGNTENRAGSDVAGIAMSADKVDDGWILNGTKAYVTNGLLADLGVITAVSDPKASRNDRMSMYLVDLNAQGVQRKKLNKQVWIPSDLTRLIFKDVFVPDDHLLGTRGRGLQQVLEVFTHSRVPIAALTLGTAVGAFNLAYEHMQKRTVFGKKIMEFQAKAFELSDFFAKIESTRLLIQKACWKIDRGADFRLASSLAKYMAVNVARQVTIWAADIFGAASVIFEHPIHKYPLDVWAAALGEGTQDVQKLIIFRELMKNYL
jgi:alkylation response protein AidB-like acyl-CoA dehydrogenase